MKICRQGNGHYLNGLNNQDFCYAEGPLKLITDGCSSALFSEVGTRLFAQQFGILEERFDVNKFEENVETVFNKIFSMFTNDSKAKEDFIVNNMLFTIIACFELDDKWIIKSMGDGYIITLNDENTVSYIRLFYGKTPPYYAYNKLNTSIYSEPLRFKTFEFPKNCFKKIGIASDGFSPIVEKKIPESFETFILGTDSKYTPEGIIKSSQSSFFDDITILI